MVLGSFFRLASRDDSGSKHFSQPRPLARFAAQLVAQFVTQFVTMTAAVAWMALAIHGQAPANAAAPVIAAAPAATAAPPQTPASQTAPPQAMPAQAPPTQTSTAQAASDRATVPAGDILRVELAKPLRESSIKPGMALDGSLFRPIYVVDRQVIPPGSHIHVVVDKIVRAPVKKGFIQDLTNLQSLGLSRKFTYAVTFRSAELTLPDGGKVPLNVGLIQTGEVVRLKAHGNEMQAGSSTKSALAKSAPGVGQIENARKNKRDALKTLHPEMTLKLNEPAEVPVSVATQPAATPLLPGQLATIPAGTHVRLLLLTGLDAALNKPGDAFETRVTEPVMQNTQVLIPEGTMLIGHVRRVVRPRVASRPASIFLSLDEIVPAQGHAATISASLDGAAMDKKDGARMDPEGGLHAGHGGVKHDMKILLIAAGTDDLADEVVEAAVHVVAPYAGLGLGLATLLLRHGEDVTLTPYSELEVVFNRPIEIPASHAPLAQQPSLPTKPPTPANPPIKN
jgi:type IV secretory pathway VirB10-like protein